MNEDEDDWIILYPLIKMSVKNDKNDLEKIIND